METGSRLGPYEVIAPLGAGGMGEVYHARDTRLDRDVAIKILTASLGADPRRRERFEREARIISSLNHPNICALFDVGRDGDHDFLVLEYLEGEPLDRRLAALKGRPLPLKQALLIAAQIADGLDKAHRAGVVHRDLKPQNIFLTKNGAKLLDFGLAKMATTSPDSVTDPPSVRPPLCNVTIDGTIVGTFFYMAPEQLAGRDADARTDIYAFGLVLYEMVTGQRPFDREGDTGVITAVFEREPPPLSAVVATLPVTLDRIVRTCLAKDPDDRFQSAHDLLLQLRWAAESAPDQAEDARPARRWRIAAFAAFAVAAAFAGRPLLSRFDPPAPTAIERFAYQMPADQIFTRAGRRPLAVSPDGARLTYAANGQLFLKSIEDLEAKPIPGTDDDPSDPSFSPDGSAIMYWSRRSGEIHTIPTSGGGATRIAKTSNPWGSSWSGTRLFVSEGAKGILELSAAGGSTRRIVPAVNGESLYGPELLPDGDTLLFTVKPANASRWDDAMIAAQSLETGARKVLIQGGTDAHLLPGALIYVHDATIMGVRFDAARLEVIGPPVPLVTGVAQASSNITGAGYYAFSHTGTLVYVPGDLGRERTIVLVDRAGRETPIAAPPKPYARVRLSPDGSRLVLEIRELDTDVWAWDTKREVMTRLTSLRSEERNAIWTRDGRRVLFASNAGGRPGIYRLLADGTGTPERLTTSEDVQAPVALSPDGKVLVFFQLKSGTALYEIKSLELDGDRAPRTMTTLPFTDPSIVFSPDGQWVAYASNESGRNEVYVQRFPTRDEAPIQLPNEGGSLPVWPRLGHEILYLDPSRRMISVKVHAGSTFTAEKPRPLFTANYFTVPLGRPFDVSDDGRTFVMIKDPQSTRQFVYVQHWLDEVARRLR